MRTHLTAILSFLAVFAPSAYPQSLSLPSVDGITVFYRAGRMSTSDMRAAPTAPCADRSTTLPMCGWGFETVYELTKDREDAIWGAELAVGYDFLALRGTMGTTGAYEVHGSIQTLPSITLYLSRDILQSRLDSRLAWYAGIGTGLIVLKNVRAYDAQGRIYALAGDTWGFTPSVGATYEFRARTEHAPGARVFIEAAYEVRDFQSIGYTLPAEVKSLPSDLPRSLSTNGPVLNVGVEISFPKKPEQKPPAAKSTSITP